MLLNTEDKFAGKLEILEMIAKAEPKPEDFLKRLDELEAIVKNKPDNSAKIKLSTMHSSKGLEFDTVFLSGLEEGIFPHNRSLDVPSEMEEERRLMYVGITRAKKNLFLSCAKRRKMWGDYKYYNPSRFISEIPPQLIDSEESDNVSSSANTQTYTFKKAVDSIKSRSLSENSDGSIKSVTSFGKSFIAPQRRKVEHNTSFVIKSKNHDSIKEERIKNDEAKIQDILDNNPIKKMLLEKKRKEAEQTANPVENQTNTINETSTLEFNSGDRVFHSKFGVGKLIFCIGIVDTYAYKQALEFYKNDIDKLSPNESKDRKSVV